jgi:hypothetical protein
MNVHATPLFQHAAIALIGALLALITLGLVLVSGVGAGAHHTALIDVAPFRWA